MLLCILYGISPSFYWQKWFVIDFSQSVYWFNHVMFLNSSLSIPSSFNSLYDIFPISNIIFFIYDCFGLPLTYIFLSIINVIHVLSLTRCLIHLFFLPNYSKYWPIFYYPMFLYIFTWHLICSENFIIFRKTLCFECFNIFQISVLSIILLHTMLRCIPLFL